jgi:hypothetical protein
VRITTKTDYSRIDNVCAVPVVFRYSTLTSTLALISHKKTLSQLQRPIIVDHYHNCTKIFKLTNCHFCPTVTNYRIILTNFSKSPNTKFHFNRSDGSRSVVCGQRDGRRDRHEACNSHFHHLGTIRLPLPTV